MSSASPSPRSRDRSVDKVLKAVMEFLAGLLVQKRLDGLGAAGSGSTLSLELGSGYDLDADERGKREAIVAFARRQLGEPYAFGAEGPADKDLDRWDCSELVEHSYRGGADMVIPDGARYQRDFCQRVPRPLPADLAYFGPNKDGVPHIILYAGDGVCIEARGRRVGGVQRGVVQNTPRFEVESHPRFEGWYRHPDFARSKEDRA